MKVRLRFGTRVLVAIHSVTAAGAALGGYTLVQIAQVADRTEKLYRHPLAVTIAVQEIRAEVFAIHRWMKDVALSRSEGELAGFLTHVDNADDRAMAGFSLVEERFLGDLSRVTEAREAFVNWRPIRSRVEQFVRDGKYREAVDITRGVGANHVEKMLRLTDAMIAFANTKATEFLNESRKEKSDALTASTSYVVGLFVFGFVIALLFARSITFPLRTLTQASTRIAGGDFSIRTGLNRADELGELSRAFDGMADSVELTVEGLSNRTRELQETAAHLAVRQRSHEAVLAVSGAVGSARTLEELLDGCIAALMEVTNGQIAAIYQAGEEDRLTLAMARGLAPGKHLPQTLEPGQGAGGLAVLRRAPVIDEVDEETRVAMYSPAGQGLPNCILHYPLVLGENVVAVVVLAGERSFDQTYQDIMDANSRQIAVALVNMRSNQLTIELAERLAAGNEELVSANLRLRTQAGEMRQQATELVRKQAELEAANRLKSEFLSNMSHELRTPLNAVISLTQLMLTRGTGKNVSEEREFLEVIGRNGEHLLGLINSILDLSKIEAGTVVVEFTNVSPSKALERVLGTIRPLATDKGLDVIVESDEIPEMALDEEKLLRVLMNLLSNAVKFTDVGTITVAVEADKREVRFIIADTGIGIPEEDQRHVFDEFRQVDGSATRRFGGTGLGLAICRRLVALMGGSIALKSTLGEGSCFTVHLPNRSLQDLPESSVSRQAPALHRDSANPATEATNSPPGEEKATSTHQATVNRTLNGPVLVVEDSPDNAAVMESVLADKYELMLASNGEDALEMARRWLPTLVLMDIQLPGMSGIEAMREIRKMEALTDTAFVAVTARAMLGDRDEMMRQGFDDYLAKPFLPAELLAIVSKWIGG